MKKIFIDLTYILNEKDLNKSTSIYVQRFLDNLDSNYIKNNNLILFVREATYSYFKKKYEKIGFSLTIFKETKRIHISFIRSIFDSLKWKKQINHMDCDVIYVPFTWIYNTLKINKKKITTIHDLRPIRETHVKHLKKIVLRMFRFYYDIAVKNADTVITISDFVRNDVFSEFGYSEKVNVVYNGIPVLQNPIEVSQAVNKKYILYVNTITEYKNLETLIKAFYLLDTEDIYLFVVGKETEYWNKRCIPFIKDNRVIRLQYVSDEELVWLYKNAYLFVTPSTREGFGYTPAEAGIYGCPIVSTKCEALPETTCNSVFYYNNPFDEKELSETIKTVLSKQRNDDFIIQNSKIQEEFLSRYNVEQFSKKIFDILVN